ncbi:MAG: dethiobiotin synthase [Planctomycetaceae bacterium]|nr:dethiobiotin synthase [Planctomycetaceae bacterium]
MSVYFITGIDTDIGKTYATGLAAQFLRQRGVSVITQKITQTGTAGTIADDILLHRRLMGIDLLPEDLDGTTCPYLFRFPASPHLAAELENTQIDPKYITNCTTQLLEKFDIVLLEGAGGINVPIRRDYLIADYVQEHRYPTIVVASGRLGSINHTLLTLEAVANRNIPMAGVVFNHYPPPDPVIRNDTLDIFRRRNVLVEMPEIDLGNIPDIDFAPIFCDTL